MHTDANATGKANAARASTCRPTRRPRRRRRVLHLLPTTGAAIGFAVRVAMMMMVAFYSSPRCGNESRYSSSWGFAMVVDAIRANPNPIFEYEMEGATTNGRRRPIYIRGDERVHWYEDKDGYTLIDDTDDEYDEMRDGGGENATTTTTTTRGGGETLEKNRTSCGGAALAEFDDDGDARRRLRRCSSA